MLRDLEETLLRIEDPGARAYMREAVLCYHGGAYRAAVVIAVAAGMDDLRRKLESLASTGGALPAVKEAHKLVDGLFKNQDAFEGTLLDRALPIDLITPAEEKKLRLTLSTRHLCGHPSGHSGSPEEARAAITTMVDLIMSRPALLGMTAVTELQARVLKPSFFPKRDVDSIRTVVAKELVVVSPALHPALVSKLISTALTLAQKRAGANIIAWKKSNAKAALDNLVTALWAMIGSPGLRVEVWRRVGPLIEEAAAEESGLGVLAGSDGPGLQGAPPLTRMRALALTRRHLKKEDARTAVRAWYEAGVLADDEIEDFKVAVRDLATHSELSANLTDTVFELSWADAVPVYLDRLVEGARSGTFTVANTSIDTVQSLTTEQAEHATQTQRVTYLKNVAANGVGTHCSNAARALVKNGLGPHAAFGNAVAEQLVEDPNVVIEGSTPALVDLLVASGLQDVGDAVAAAQAAAPADPFGD